VRHSVVSVALMTQYVSRRASTNHIATSRIPRLARPQRCCPAATHRTIKSDLHELDVHARSLAPQGYDVTLTHLERVPDQVPEIAAIDPHMIETPSPFTVIFEARLSISPSDLEGAYSAPLSKALSNVQSADAIDLTIS